MNIFHLQAHASFVAVHEEDDRCRDGLLLEGVGHKLVKGLRLHPATVGFTDK